MPQDAKIQKEWDCYLPTCILLVTYTPGSVNVHAEASVNAADAKTLNTISNNVNTMASGGTAALGDVLGVKVMVKFKAKAKVKVKVKVKPQAARQPSASRKPQPQP